MSPSFQTCPVAFLYSPNTFPLFSSTQGALVLEEKEWGMVVSKCASIINSHGSLSKVQGVGWLIIRSSKVPYFSEYALSCGRRQSHTFNAPLPIFVSYLSLCCRSLFLLVTRNAKFNLHTSSYWLLLWFFNILIPRDSFSPLQ